MVRRQEGWWIAALAASVAVPVASPWLGTARALLETRLGGSYADALAIGLIAVGGAAFVVAVASIRTRRAVRYGLLAAALALVALETLLWGEGIRRIDLVERVHLVEYAAIALLYSKAFEARVRDFALPLLAILAATLVGMADETIQSISPVRVGDMRDVLLNGWAAAIGALFALALAPPRHFALRPRPASVRALRRLALVVLVAGAALFSRIGVGTVIHDPRAGVFVSTYRPAELLEVRDERARRWRTAPPGPFRPLGLQDDFLTEAGFHKATRDRAAASGAARQALFENRILERWYTPYLALHSFETGDPNRWSPAMHARIEAAARRGAPSGSTVLPGPYRSPVLATRLLPVPRSLLWAVVAVGAAALWWGGRLLEQRLARPGDGAVAGAVAGAAGASQEGPLLLR